MISPTVLSSIKMTSLKLICQNGCQGLCLWAILLHSNRCISLHGSTVPGCSVFHWCIWQIKPHIQSHDACFKTTLLASHEVSASYTAHVTSEMLRIAEQRCHCDKQFCCKLSHARTSTRPQSQKHTLLTSAWKASGAV